ncbi:cupin domain-containing protein [Pacificoceanicola onchidii]|uniref:cupin domain-containing protein n=1 Tax=Pacificoceanicola onchidii TaxID=2562685 RepID=UPI0010A3A8D1|nr:cupin domain-containing protein [Pacificoceanicola onchidii]
MAFNPNRSTIASCMAELREIQKEFGIDPKRIVTSRDPAVRKLAYTKLDVSNVPDGFTKTRLPVFFEEPTTMYISAGAPGAKVPRHSHDEGDGIRFMISGSIRYGDNELTQGDWMFIPAGADYEFEVGPMGAVMCYCYCCCCA